MQRTFSTQERTQRSDRCTYAKRSTTPVASCSSVRVRNLTNSTKKRKGLKSARTGLGLTINDNRPRRWRIAACHAWPGRIDHQGGKAKGNHDDSGHSYPKHMLLDLGVAVDSSNFGFFKHQWANDGFQSIARFPQIAAATELRSTINSYAWKDRAFAQRVQIELNLVGAKVWIDCTNVRGGDVFSKQISQALEWGNTRY